MDSWEMKDDNLDFITEKSKRVLNYRQQIRYNDFRKAHFEWLATQGKNPAEKQAYAKSEIRTRMARLDQFYRWVWDEFETHTINVSNNHADAFVDGLAEDEVCRKDTGEPYAGGSKRKFTNTLESFFEWKARERGGERWEPEIQFDQTVYNRADPFTREERRRLREAAMEYKTIPVYDSLNPEDRDRWKAYIAQELGKPKDEVSPDDWERLNQDWKIPSLIYSSLDAAFRPIEVKRANTGWLKLDKRTLHIPKDDSAKNRENWEVALRDETVDILKRWKAQRTNHTKYDNSDILWLNRKGNPYTSKTLNYLLGNLIEQAEIDATNRKLVWYSIRHSTGTHMIDQGELVQAKEQLRHKSLDSTLQYKHPTPETRRDTLDKMG